MYSVYSVYYICLYIVLISLLFHQQTANIMENQKKNIIIQKKRNKLFCMVAN